MRKMLAFVAGVVMAMTGVFVAPATATTCGSYKSEWNTTNIASASTSVTSEVRFRMCTGNLGNQFADLAWMKVSYNWNAGDPAVCGGWGDLEYVIYNPRFWDTNDAYDPGVITLWCEADGQHAYVWDLSTAPDLRIDQSARWEDVIHIGINNAPDYDLVHGGRYY